MEKPSDLLTATEFFDKLQSDELETLIPFSIIGMVKKSEGREEAIEFSPGGHCSHWVKIPLEMIENVKVLKIVTCKDHTHPLVKLHLKSPRTVEGKIFLSLLEALQNKLEKLEQRAAYSGSGPSGPRTMTGPSRSTRIMSQPGGPGGIGGGGGYTWGECADLQYQCVCVEWEHRGFGMDYCIREECEFVCVRRP
jgi:hypothetical protein